MNIPSDAELRELVARGEIWKLKQRLQSAVKSAPFHARRYEDYGRVLLAMGDSLEAGKYFYLSGVRKPQYDAAITLYWQRFGRHRSELIASFPRAMRKLAFEQLPAPVQDDLQVVRHKFTGQQHDSAVETPAPLTFRQRGTDALMAVFMWSVIALFLIALVIGFSVIVGVTVGWTYGLFAH